MNYLLKDCLAVIPGENNFQIKKGDIKVIDGKISSGKGIEPDKIIDCEGRVVMPGLVNAHHHIYSQLSKGINCPVPFGNFAGILQNLWWPLDKSLNEESVLLSTVLTLEESIKQGVTTIFDHHISARWIEGSLSKMAEVFAAYKVQGRLAFEISDRNGEEVMQRSLAENREFARKQKGQKVQGMLGLHASFTLSDASLDKITLACPDLPVHIHVAEDEADRRITLEAHDSPLIERLFDFGLIRPGSLLVHCNELLANEWEKLQDEDIYIVQAVDSNMNNGVNTANIHELENRGIRFTAGTDGMSSNILKSFKNSFLLCRYKQQNADIGFIEAASMLRSSYELKRQYGYDLGLQEGETADLVVFDYKPYTELNSANFMSHWLYGLTESRVKEVLKGKDLLLENYTLCSQPYEEIKHWGKRITSRLFSRYDHQEQRWEI